MSRIPLSLPVKLLPAALAAAFVMLGSTAAANAQYYDRNPPADQASPQDQGAQTDPPDRVARLAYLAGDVEFSPAGENDWGNADTNRPLITGDRLLTGNDGRAALELGDAALRINDDSAFNFLDLNDTTTQVELSQGTLNLRVRRLADGQTYEVDTPTVAFVAGEPGTYRVDVAPGGNGAMVTVFEGSGTVYGENGASRTVQAGQSYRFDDNTLANVAVQGVPAPDDFDRFCDERDSRYANSASRRYVSDDVVGYDDLDQYGDWQATADYGEVWYPTRVVAGWAPYRDGHWAWIEPWGWTWVDDEPWGYAPFHYGRWAYVGNRWGWVPGPRTVRAVYAPALVAFVGGSGFSVSINLGGGEPVGWFPLGPRDVYVPPYRASRNYFTSINVSNIRNVYVNRTTINNYYAGYSRGQRFTGGREYAYRDNPHAFTAVPRNVFAGARPVRPAVLNVKATMLAKATVAPIPHIAPTRASLGVAPPKRPLGAPLVKAFDRTVVARHAPPARPVPFATREKVIAKQDGAPIPVAQLRQMRQQRAPDQPQRVRVLAASNQPTKASRTPTAVRAPADAAHPRARASIHPIQAPMNPPRSTAPSPSREAPLRPGELPSARFAHPQPKAPESRAAETRQSAGQNRQNVEQTRVNSERSQAQQRAQTSEIQARQNAEQSRQQDLRAQQAQQSADQERQRQDQQRAQHAEQARQAQQQAEQPQTRERAEQARAAQQQAEQQRAQQQAQQDRMQQERQQRDEQMRAQQEQQRQSQMEAQQQREQARAQQQQRAEQIRDQQRQHAQPPQRKQEEQKKRKDHDQQDNGH